MKRCDVQRFLTHHPHTVKHLSYTTALGYLSPI